MSIFTHDTLMADLYAISVSGGQRLKVLKNRDFLILLFLSLNEGVRGILSPDKQSALATFRVNVLRVFVLLHVQKHPKSELHPAQKIVR